MNFENSQKVKDLQEKITDFMNAYVYEAEISIKSKLRKEVGGVSLK